MLVNATEMLKKAKAGHYAVGQFNINNLEWTKAILQTAQELNSPVILGVSEGAGKYMTGYKTVVGMVNGMMEELNITVPVALHLDHGSYDGCLKCVEAGFSSIMFDGSHYPIDENVAKTKELVKIVAEHNMSLEAEVGSIGGEEDGVVGMGECADPEECKRVADLGINFLAIQKVYACICCKFSLVSSTLECYGYIRIICKYLVKAFRTSNLSVRTHRSKKKSYITFSMSFITSSISLEPVVAASAPT